MTSLIASCYLLFRQGNAFAPDITSPVRLRRWTAAFFAAMALSHLWYLPIVYVATSDNLRIAYLIGGLLDCITVIPLSVIVLLTMLQDRRRPLWPAFALTAPLVVIIVYYMISSHDILIPMVRLYLLLLGIGYFIYIVRASRQYGRWLCDNYADLEHKEVWMSFVVVTTILLMLGFYATDLGEGIRIHRSNKLYATGLLPPVAHRNIKRPQHPTAASPDLRTGDCRHSDSGRQSPPTDFPR